MGEAGGDPVRGPLLADSGRPLQLVATIQLHGRVAFLPFAPARIKCLMHKKIDFEDQTIGERLRKKRRELRLRQKDVATVLGVSPWTVLNWENGIAQPKVQHIPAIRRLLGFDPNPQALATIADRLRHWRHERGWSQAQAARETGVDPSTWSSWEAGGTIVAKAHRALVARFVGLPEFEVYALMRRQWNDSHQRRTPGDNERSRT